MVKTLRNFLFVVMTVFAIFLAGCGGGDGSSTTTTPPTTPSQPPSQNITHSYGYVFDNEATSQTVSVGADVKFSNNGALQGVTHDPGTSTITVTEAGIYNLTFAVNTYANNPQYWGIAINGTVQHKFAGSGQTYPIGSTIVNLNAGDTISLRNLGTVPDPAVIRPSVNAVWLQIDKVGDTYGYVFDNRLGTTNQQISVGNDVLFNTNGLMQNVTHTADTSNITISQAGDYAITFAFNSMGNNPEDWGVAVNGTVQAHFSSAGQNGGGSLGLTLNAGDVVSIRNVATMPNPANTRTIDANSTWVRVNKLDGYYGYVVIVGTQSVPVGTDLLWSGNGPMNGVSHTAGTASVVVTNAGTYKMTFGINTSANNPQFWGVAVNGTVVQHFGCAGQTLFGATQLTLAAGDVVTIRNEGTLPDPATVRIGDGNSAWLQIDQVD